MCATPSARFGVPYFVSILCFDGASRAPGLSCREADQVACCVSQGAHTSPAARRWPRGNAERNDRPARQASADFTYYAPGDMFPGTGMRGQGGRADSTGLFQHPLPDGAGAGLRQFAVVHELGQLRSHRPRLARRPRQGRGYRCRVNDIRLSPTNRKTTPIRGAIISANTAILGRRVPGRPRPPGRGHPAGFVPVARSRTPIAASPISTTSSRCATAWCCARRATLRSISWSTRPASTSASATCT